MVVFIVFLQRIVVGNVKFIAADTFWGTSLIKGVKSPCRRILPTDNEPQLKCSSTGVFLLYAGEIWVIQDSESLGPNLAVAKK
jgi:hypothetical protein